MLKVLQLLVRISLHAIFFFLYEKDIVYLWVLRVNGLGMAIYPEKKMEYNIK